MEQVEPQQVAPSRPGRMKRAQSAFREKLRKNEQPETAEAVKPSTLARRGWRGLYARRARKRLTKDEQIREIEKSRLLFSQLFIFTPMVVTLASNALVDGIGERRVPVLLEQVSVRIEPFDSSESKRTLMKLHLEYGAGVSQLKWSIIRSYRDFLFFHGHLVKSKVWHRRGNPKPPHLPRPRDYGRRLKDPNEEMPEDDNSSVESDRAPTFELALERYLRRVFTAYSFHGDSNRILHFLELSKLGISLAASTNFHGKEGPVFVRGRASDQGWRVRHWQPHDISSMIQRHTQKWLLVRESFLVITEGINSTEILDVFLLDPKFTVKEGEEIDMEDPTRAKGLFLTMHNASRSLRVATRGELDLGSWVHSIQRIQEKSPWAKPHRFDSFAPVRKNVSCEWFVDGRDYMWTVSEALENARDTIFIHDWWLSPELYLRRPPEGNQRWRLDRVLKRAAERGVKIYVIVYRNIDLAIPIDSLWTKHSLLDMHPNIHVLRSPNQPKQKAAMFWAHHEKLCMIDSTIAFAGGIDLCYGRWDTPQHTVIDDAYRPFYETNDDTKRASGKHKTATQTWPGKDYSNPRVKDFFELDKPWDDMYDRQITPRMPWHDIHQTVMGQPARDLARHFVQRWNYVIRQKLPSRPTPLLIPAPDFTEEELERFNLTGTCEYQVLRSSCNWSIGLKHHEQSIQNAYLKLIDTSEHFIYIENQFFVTSTEVDGVKIENQIGNALVQRIIRAHQNGEQWRAIIVIPLMPGFEAPVDSSEASSVRVICQCQFNSISRGTHSIFYKLESAGISPENYITFFSLRKWGKIGPESRLTTEQLYIHAKMMVADDRAAIIGSANINERSMRGIRDSEVAVCVRDTATIDTVMAGRPYKAAKFAYTLRLRVMREHLGIDTDKVDCIEQLTDYLMQTPHPQENDKRPLSASMTTPISSAPGSPGVLSRNTSTNFIPQSKAAEQDEDLYVPDLHSFNWLGGTEANPGLRDHKKFSTDRRVQGSEAHRKDVEGYGLDQWAMRMELEKEEIEHAINPAIDESYRTEAIDVLCEVLENHNPKSIVDFKRIFYNTWCKQPAGEVIGVLPRPVVDDEGRVTCNEQLRLDPWCFDDPVSDEFYHGKWLAAAERNTDIYRQVFRCQPDNQVTTWREYKKYQAHEAAFYEKQAREGGPESCKNPAPERVNIHVSEKNKHENDSSTNVPELGGKVPGTSVHRQSDVKRNSSAGLNVIDEEQSPEEVMTSASSSSSSPEDQEEEEQAVEEQIGQYEGHAGGSTSAGVPGLPSWGAVFGTNKAFDPKNTAFPENPQHKNWVNEENVHVHAKHKQRQYVDASEVPSQVPEDPPKVTVDDTALNNNKSPDASVIDTSSTVPPGGVNIVDVNGLSTSVSEDDLNGVHSNGNGLATRKFTSTSRNWKHYDQVLSAQSAEEVLSAVTGHLVLFPAEWLYKELESGNWNFQMDRMTPLEIYD